MIPDGVARPASWVAASTWRQVQPPPTRTVRSAAFDLDRLQRRQVEDDAVVADAEAAAVVAAAADGERQLVAAREGDRGGHVVRARAPGDERRAPVDHRVEDRARLVVARVFGSDQLAAEGSAELLTAAIAAVVVVFIESPLAAVSWSWLL